MVSLKLIILIAILAILLNQDTVEAAVKKTRRNIKASKKPNQNSKLKPTLKQVQAPKTNQRNGKMNFYNPHLWSAANTFYRPATTSSSYLRSPLTSSSLFYPMHWGNSFINPTPFMSSTTIRRSDPEHSVSSPISPSTMGNSQIPTLYDMSAFTGNAALVENPFSNSNQNVWSMAETFTPPTPKPKYNLFNSFNYNDDGGLFSGFLNHIL